MQHSTATGAYKAHIDSSQGLRQRRAAIKAGGEANCVHSRVVLQSQGGRELTDACCVQQVGTRLSQSAAA